VLKQYFLNDKLEVKEGDYIYRLVDRSNKYLILNDDIYALMILCNSNDSSITGNIVL